MTQFLDDLDQLIKDRKHYPEKDSYTSELFQKGLDRILKKIGEESGEVIIAAKNKDDKELIHESADLIFHLMVVLRNQNLSFQDVVDALQERHKKRG